METIISKPPLMHAIRNADDPGQIMVYRSTEIESGHRIHHQLCRAIDACWSIESQRPPRRSVMLGGEAVFERARVHARCPGSSVPHECREVGYEQSQIRIAG